MATDNRTEGATAVADTCKNKVDAADEPLSLEPHGEAIFQTLKSAHLLLNLPRNAGHTLLLRYSADPAADLSAEIRFHHIQAADSDGRESTRYHEYDHDFYFLSRVLNDVDYLMDLTDDLDFVLEHLFIPEVTEGYEDSLFAVLLGRYEVLEDMDDCKRVCLHFDAFMLVLARRLTKRERCMWRPCSLLENIATQSDHCNELRVAAKDLKLTQLFNHDLNFAKSIEYIKLWHRRELGIWLFRKIAGHKLPLELVDAIVGQFADEARLLELETWGEKFVTSEFQDVGPTKAVLAGEDEKGRQIWE